MSQDPGRAEQLLDSANLSSRLLLGLAGTRLELFAAELELEVARVRESAALLLGALVCGSLALVVLVLLAVVAFWDTHRMAAMIGSAAVLLVAAAGLWFGSQRRIHGRPAPFAASRHELAADCSALAGGARP